MIPFFDKAALRKHSDIFRKITTMLSPRPTAQNADMADHTINVNELMEKYTVEELCESSEKYFAKLTNWDYLLSKPFASPDEASSILMNFSHLIKGLQLAPGSIVLDFGAGSCWASRLLNQMRCSVISLDTSVTALSIGKKLKERHPVFGNQPQHTFLPFDGRKVNLPDGSVDRIFCFDAFHHVPNQSEILSEMHRILKEGGIAGFSEPGPDHSKSAQAQEEMRNHAVVENDILILDIFDRAKKVGFTDNRLLIYSLEPVMTTFDKSGQLLEQGNLFLDYVYRTIDSAQNHNTFFLYKGEPDTNDSRYRDGLLADIAINVNSVRLKEGKSFYVEARVKNISNKVWLPSGANTGSVNLGLHLHDADKNILHSDYLRAPLSEGQPKKILPGEAVIVRCKVPAFKAGKYVLEFDLVSEHICWFKENGSATQLLKVHVEQ